MVDGEVANGAVISLFGIDNQTNELISIDAATGVATAIGSTGFEAIDGLTFGSSANTLYGVDDLTGQLIVIGTGTGAGTIVGATDVLKISTLAYYPRANIIYGSDSFNDQLVAIDPMTGAANAVGSLGFANVLGLAFDPVTDTLYGIDFVFGQCDVLITMDTSTGPGTVVGQTGGRSTQSLTFDPVSMTLYAVDTAFPDTLVTINPSTGSSSAIGQTGNAFQGITSVAIAPTTSTTPTPVDLNGSVKTADGQDICAIVLASGQYMFSCNPAGVFSLLVLPRENNGTVKRQIYADGFFPKIDILRDSSNDAVVMTRSGACPSYNMQCDPSVVPGSAGKRINITGKVLL